MNAARHDGEHECVTTEQCQEKHNMLAWVISFVLILFGFVGLSGPAAYITAKDARATADKLEARVDEQQKALGQTLQEMRIDIREIKEALRTTPRGSSPGG